MRRFRIVIAGGMMPAIVGVVLEPACGGQATVSPDAEAEASSASDSTVDDSPTLGDATDAPVIDTGPDGAPIMCQNFEMKVTYTVTAPPPGVPADPGQICAVTMPPVVSNTSARVTLAQYSPQNETASGHVAIPSNLQVVGTPTITVSNSFPPQFASMMVSNIKAVQGGFDFNASWPMALPHPNNGGQMAVKTTFTIACPDGGTQIVESTTNIQFCIDGSTYAWVSNGDQCTICQTIAEMAPTPIVSDNRGDDLPLGRVLRLRIVELARAGDTVLLMAENDGGALASYEWRAFGGTIEHVAEDVVLWKPSGEGAYGQVAVFTEEGAAVENFIWRAA